MSANLFKMEFIRILKPTLIWLFFICFFIYIDMLFYKQMIESGVFEKILGLMNTPFIGNMAKSMGVNPAQLTDTLGFYAIRNTLITMLMGSIYAVITSSSLIAMEEFEKTSEFLMSRPITRLEIINTKLSAFLINLVILNLVSSIVGYISLEIFKMTEYSLNSYIILCIYTFLLTLIFGAIGLFLSLLMKRGRVFIGAIIGIVFGTYFIDIISRVTESANFIGYFSPFHFANKEVLTPGYHLATWDIIYFISGTLLLFIISYRVFLKKDIMV